MKVKRVDILFRDFSVVVELGSGCYVLFGPFEHKRGISQFGHILVPVPQPLDDPTGFQINKNSQVIGGVRFLEYSHHLHLQWVDSGQVEEGLRRRHQTVPRFEVETVCNFRPEHTITQHC